MPKTPNARRAALWASALALLAAAAGGDRPLPEFKCRQATDEVRCEATYVWPAVPEWTSGDGRRVFQRERGIVVWLTVDSEWRRLEVATGRGQRSLFLAMVRLRNGRAQFATPAER